MTDKTKVMMNVRVSKDLHEEIKIKAIKENKKLQNLIEQILIAYLKK